MSQYLVWSNEVCQKYQDVLLHSLTVCEPVGFFFLPFRPSILCRVDIEQEGQSSSCNVIDKVSQLNAYSVQQYLVWPAAECTKSKDKKNRFAIWRADQNIIGLHWVLFPFLSEASPWIFSLPPRRQQAFNRMRPPYLWAVGVNLVKYTLKSCALFRPVDSQSMVFNYGTSKIKKYIQ